MNKALFEFNDQVVVPKATAMGAFPCNLQRHFVNVSVMRSFMSTPTLILLLVSLPNSVWRHRFFSEFEKVFPHVEASTSSQRLRVISLKLICSERFGFLVLHNDLICRYEAQCFHCSYCRYGTTSVKTAEAVGL